MILGVSKSKFLNDVAMHDRLLLELQEQSISKDDFITKVLDMYDNLKIPQYELLIMATVLSQAKYDMLKIELALASNTSHMVNLCKVGLGRLFDELQYQDSSVMSFVMPSFYPVTAMFNTSWDLYSVYRSIVPFIFKLNPLEFKYDSDAIQDFQIFIYNRCLLAVHNLQYNYPDYFNEPSSVIVDRIMNCLYEDAIGSDTRGIETFFNNFVKYMTTQLWSFNGADAYDNFVEMMDRFCSDVINEFEMRFSHRKFRIAIYMRFKLFRYRVNPKYDQEFYTYGGVNGITRSLNMGGEIVNGGSNITDNK